MNEKKAIDELMETMLAGVRKLRGGLFDNETVDATEELARVEFCCNVWMTLHREIEGKAALAAMRDKLGEHATMMGQPLSPFGPGGAAPLFGPGGASPLFGPGGVFGFGKKKTGDDGDPERN